MNAPMRLRRYDQLTDALRAREARTLVEVGTWNGVRAQELATAALERSPHVTYHGFDLFEALSDQELEEELSKRPPSQAEVEASLAEFQEKVARRGRLLPSRRRSFDFALHQGYTRDTLPAFRREHPEVRADFVFIDGGHKVETIESDWDNTSELVAPDGVVFLDDYYGNAELAQRFGCNRLVERLRADESWDVEVLPAADDIAALDGTVQIVRVTRTAASRPVRFVTSFNATLFEASGRRCVESFRHHNPGYELWCYIEADDAPALAELEAEVEALGATVVRLDDQPLLDEFFELARDVIPQELGGDASPEMFPGEGPASGDVWFRKHMFRWFRKVVSLDHAATGFDGVLFWMDCDCVSTAPLPQAVIEHVFAGAGVIHMKAKRQHSETGVVGYDLAVPGVRELLANMKEHYMSRSFVDYPRWDDCITLDLCLARPDAPPARDIARRVVANAEVLPATPLKRYLRHDKGLHSRGLNLVS
jgi:hypothetical protein